MRIGRLNLITFYISQFAGRSSNGRTAESGSAYRGSSPCLPAIFFMSEWFETEIRVRYAETDKMGIVHHSNYLIWFELGRSEFCRARGFSYLEMEEKDNALLVVAETYCRYKSPAYYEDLITIRTKIADIRSRSVQFIYQVFRASSQTLIAEGETLHLVTDKNKKVCSLPKIYKKKLLTELPAQDNLLPENHAPH